MTTENTPSLIGLDLGTSNIKGVVTDLEGTVLGTVQANTTYTRPHDRWVIADAEAWRDNVFRVIHRLTAQTPGPIRAMAYAAASGNTLLAMNDGTPRTPVFNWMDERCVGDLPDALRDLTVEEVWRVTGWPCVDTFPLAHLAWLRENEPILFEQAERVCMDTDWLGHELTGQWVMDPSTATTFHLQDQLARRYHRPFLDRMGIPESKLSRLIESGVSVGAVTPQAARMTGLDPDTQIFTGCFDHPSAARGVGVLEPGQLLLSCGTSWVGFFPEPDRQKIIDASLLCDPFLSRDGGPWGAILSVPRIGPTIDAYVHEAIAPNDSDPYAAFTRLAAEVAPGAGGLTIDLRRPRQPINDTRANIARAVMEGAAHLLNDRLQALRGRGFHFEQAVMVGGPTKSPLWPEIVAEITGLKLSVGSPLAGAQGAAMLAGQGAK